MDHEEAEASKANFDADIGNKCKELNKLIMEIQVRLKSKHGYVVPKHYVVTKQLDDAITSLKNSKDIWDTALKG